MEYNIGDDLCRASLYFDLPKKHNYIEGGVYKFGEETKNDILWGVGRSIKELGDFTHKNNKALLYSCRDRVSDMPFVPCPSVFSVLADIPVGKKQSLILGGSDTIGRTVSNFPNVAMNKKDYITAFTSTAKIVTNSYHTAYWALLSGRAVKVVGYSSKFTDLFTIFDLDTSLVVTYNKGSFSSFNTAISRLKNIPWVSASCCYKKYFRQLNIEYYDKVLML